MNSLPSNPTGWWLSEKLDGAFCRWTGTAFMSRNGHQFRPPSWWLDGMPMVMLDGELWTQRGDFDGLVSAIQRKRNAWEGVTFQVFDLAVLRMPLEARLARLKRLRLPAHVSLVNHRPCLSMADLDAAEERVVDAGGEGLILREAGSDYRPGAFVKVKRIHRNLTRNQLDG